MRHQATLIRRPATLYVSSVRDGWIVGPVILSVPLPADMAPQAFAEKIRAEFPDRLVLVEIIEDTASPNDPALLAWLPGQQRPLGRPDTPITIAPAD